MTASMWPVNGHSQTTCGKATTAVRGSVRRGTLSVMLSSPEFSDGEETPACHSGTSSVEGSRPSSSDRFVLTGEFSSFESDAFVSGSSDRGWSPPTEQLADLRTIFERNGSLENRKKVKIAPIEVSDTSSSSSSSDESYSSDDSSSSDSDAQAPNLPSSRRYHKQTNYCLVVSIPLLLIKDRLKLPPRKTSKESNPNTKPSVEKHTARGSEPTLSPAGLKGLRIPLSLKLKRMSSSNNYTIVSSNINGVATSRTFPVATSSATVVGSSTSNSTSGIAGDRTVTLPKSCPPLCTSTAASNTCLEPVATSASVTASSSISNETEVSESVAEQLPASCVAASPVRGGHAHVVPSNVRRDLLMEFDPLNLGPRLPSTPAAVMEDASAALPEAGVAQDLNSSSMSVESAAPSTTRKTGASACENSICQPFSVNSRPTVAFSFSRLFSFYPSDLTLQDNELVPIHSLSLKNADIIPEDHPVYTWTIGKAVESSRKRKKSGVNH